MLVFGMVCVCLSVRPSQACVYQNCGMDRAIFSAYRLSLIYSTLCFKEIYISKNKATPLWTRSFSETLDLQESVRVPSLVLSTVDRSLVYHNVYSMKDAKQCYARVHLWQLRLVLNNTVLWLGGVAVERWTCDQEVAGSMLGHTLSGDNSGQVVNTHVPLFTKQYKLVPCEGFMFNAPSYAAIHWSNE